ncbi:valine--tRNA ligase [Riemerella anatipestifer]|uniref:Valine--tRNA ligase n=1 Tax=Riemerella anatipestifer (strain ATCC 11845 / DSM 15868 / JCM 9532 / NCTC 11014) TaxID=693978 RepID=E4TBM2_RIEAD|nr:valine--tRNA ligase [Riemerella anatipestifer]ADQ81851.1 valyl-tRNA synthetase [Riemerella anatipestifer ATCC 11845 = DSM 15868]ADZ12649.1 Valyl-tRNA synthetase [Riemerella anatipestifer RA-GD]AFD55862.1 valyl-tRNA synthetase [Riemerella anatipestifer ATCC 11845 = DSM 15868]MDD1525397.1 valine--tRNA ligase [Riemerella anatipestifer]MRM91555.1 valine--tRNA ligase [Riemerella anatipestifer]
MQISEKYTPSSTEQKWYNYWLENKYFHSEPNHKPPYTIVIPPPNVTGILHMGHMLNNTIQDVLIRRARMRGYNACWVPGTDHASIATEAKVVAKLKAEGINKSDISREEFLKHAWEWTHKYGGTILEQLKKLGCSCDWDRTRFTMEDKLSEQVIKSFVDLYNKGLIYRGYRMVNWDPEAKTNISDEEVIFKEQNGKLYHLKYQIEGTQDFLTVATTRPETIFGDVAVCVNPNDERYQKLIGKTVIVPIVNRSVPIIADEYVDIEFGTGTLKITPAHDVNDYEIGQKHQLQIIDAIDDDGKLNHHGMHYEGKDRFVVRKEIAKELEEKGLLAKAEDYVNKVGTSERTGAVIEPKISQQWFLKMSEIAKPALEVVMNDEIKFYPDKFKNTYKYWMENIRDWNISRQLWWGQQIPAYYYGEGENDFVVAENAEKALELAREKAQNPNLGLADLKQDEDALDTWFSSWLWPMSVFDGLLNPNSKEINYYYPTTDLVTGPDIIFFWVARMIMAGLEWRGKVPFKNVYFTGIVRDKQRRKMSKSLGNSPDPIELIDKYGADSVRVGILLSSAAGNDLLFDEDLMLQGRNFATKIWNAFRLVQGWKQENKPAGAVENQTIEWFGHLLDKTVKEINEQFEKFRISDALHLIYKLIWDDFCSWYLEAIKPNYGEGISKEVYDKTIAYFEELMKLLHPFMPFLTEELWQNITSRNTDEALIIAQQKEASEFDVNIINQFDIAKEWISGVRNYRQSKGISPKETVELYTNALENSNEALIKKLANVSDIYFNEKTDKPSFSFLVGSTELSIPLSETLDLEEEKKKTEEELSYLKGFLASVEKKLSNEKFVSGAPEKVVEMERKKQKDAQDKIALLEEKLKTLG